MSGCWSGAQAKVDDGVRLVQHRWIPPAADERRAARELRADWAPGLRRRLGRVTLRLRVRQSTLVMWRALELHGTRSAPRGTSFLRVVCLCVWDAWKHLLGEDGVKWMRVYARDLHSCTCPVCSRRWVTPHHIVFRSRGGGDSDSNLTSLCATCHLFLVHRGLMSVEGSAPDLTWHIGEDGRMVVVGRELEWQWAC